MALEYFSGCDRCTKRGKHSREELPHVRGQGQKQGRTPCPKGGGQEELPHIRGQGQRLRVPGCNGAGTAEKSYSSPRSGVVAWRSYPTPEARNGGREDQPHVQGVVATRAQEGLEALVHVEG